MLTAHCQPPASRRQILLTFKDASLVLPACFTLDSCSEELPSLWTPKYASASKT